MTTVIFSHGQESGPWGTKIKAMAAMVKELGCSADSIDRLYFVRINQHQILQAHFIKIMFVA